MSNTSTEAAPLQHAARHGLVAESRTLTLGGDDARRAVQLARSDRLSGLLAQAIDAGSLETDETTRRTIVRTWHEQLRACVVLEALVVRTSQLLTESGVDHRLTKGAAVAHLDYDDPSTRPFGDVDMVVHPDHWQRAITLLTEADYRRPAVPLPGGYDDRYGKGATLTSPDRLELDLHRRFAIGRFGVTSHLADVFEQTELLELGGVAVPVLAAPDRLLHACHHAVLGGRPRLRAFRDIAQLLLGTGADWESTFVRAESWRADVVVARAIVETWRRLGLVSEHPALEHARSIKVSRRDAWAIRQFAEPTSFRRQALTTIIGLPPRRIPGYLATMTKAVRRRQR